MILSFLLDYELHMQILAAGLFLVGTLLLAFSLKPFEPKYKKNYYMPMKIIQWQFHLGISLNCLAFLLIVLVNLAKFLCK